GRLSVLRFAARLEINSLRQAFLLFCGEDADRQLVLYPVMLARRELSKRASIEPTEDDIRIGPRMRTGQAVVLDDLRTAQNRVERRRDVVGNSRRVGQDIRVGGCDAIGI